MKFVRWAFLALSLGMVLLVTLWESEQNVSPGPLNPAHAAKAELTAGNSCEQCHGNGGTTVDAKACNHCHEAIGQQLERHRGLHGALAISQIQDCGRCHREHHDAEIKLLDERAFQLAGIEQPDRYDHRFVPDFALVGKHTALRCEQCHKQAKAATPPADGRFLGLATTCTACHEDHHKGEFGDDCNKCHGQEQPFDRVPGFQHTKDFPLVQAHADQRCNQCHIKQGPHSVAALMKTPLQKRACVDCHDSPHGQVAEGAARKAMAITDAADCSRCHDATQFKRHGVTNQNHKDLGFAVLGVHAPLRCEQCHGAHGQKPVWQVAAPRPSQCSACHASPHRTQFVSAVLALGAADNDCAGCHHEQQQHFAQGIVTPEQHAVTGFALALPHDRLACDQCHGKPTDNQPYEQRHPGRDPSDCRACHKDVHNGQFDRNPGYRQCTACHLPTHFAPPSFELDAHSQSAFPLLGQHQAVACRKCHDKVDGDVRQFVNTPVICASCHQDPHRGQFDKAGLPAQVEGRSGCARCHDELRFRPVISNFEHGLWAGFPLVKSHAAVECAKCHGRQPGKQGPTLGKVLGTHCVDCHQDVHQGQFRRGDVLDCQRCHDESKFKDIKFDHQRDSRFKLDSTHVKVQCGQCHLAVATPAGPVTRYRPLGVDCRDCHIPGGSKGTRK